MKIFRKILFYTLLAFAALFLGLTVSVFLFKEKIISQFIREANKNLNTPVKIGKMDISMFPSFPQLSIVLNDVYIEDSHDGQYPLLTASEISFQLSPIQVWQGNFTIEGLKIKNSETNLKINQQGKNNYTILKETGKTSGNASTVKFRLEKVNLESTLVHYVDVNAEQLLTFRSGELLASIQSANNIYDIEAEGELTTERISVNENEFLTGKSFQVKSDLVYDDVQKTLVIKPSTLDVRNSSFSVEGSYKWKEKNIIDITTEGKDTDIQTLLSLLTDGVAKKFERYKSKGDVYITAKLKGEISRKVSPSIAINFGFKDATLFNPESKSQITSANIEGSFSSPQILDIQNAVLNLKNINGELNGEPFTGDFRLRDFKDPDVACSFHGKLDAASLLDFYPVQNISKLSGSLLANVSFHGRVGLLKKRATAQRVSTQGTIDLQNIGFSYGEDQIQLQNLTGGMQFNNNDLALSNVSGKLGNSDFLLNGFFKNIITFLLFENQPIGIETDLKSNFLDVDQLFALGFEKPEGGAARKKPEYEFKISRNINLNFNCDVKALRYKRFHATELKGDLLVKNEMAVSRNIKFNSMGGEMTFSGIVDAKNNKAIDVVSTFKLNGIYVDSVFYVFENFDQSFIVDKHLKGQANADVSLEFTLNQNLRLYQETLVSDISTSIKNGELNNFEPMKKLNKYLNDEGLSKLRFSDIKNEIHIENKTVYIPQMEVRTNVTSIKVSGTHTFDQRIDYRIIAPLRNNKNINYSEAKEALEDDGSGQSKLFLKITGTTDNYSVSYDTESVKKKIVSDLKKEVLELKEAFKNKGTKEKKEIELQEDEYFDW
ncbi:MAG TPA: AsmA-like C-terminal region-containing protein [Chryseolinea sp.]|nr:AsmA-like C-terminal region-containing protein [Chryseolinea sp.]